MAKTIKVISVGKVHDPKLRDAISYYETCASSIFRIDWHFIAPSKTEANHRASAVASESKVIVRTLKEAEYVMLLDEHGKQFTSEQFSKELFGAMETFKDVAVIIGGAFGVDESVKARANCIVSFGSMVLPHQLMRLVLCEQIYRATTIQNGSSYHHA
jgi:23S rRNA (pseudouridine1915-N3)-methyltransferase